MRPWRWIPKEHLLYVTVGENRVAVLNGGTGDPDHDVLYLAGQKNELRAVNADSGDVIAAIAVPFRPSVIAADVANRVVYAAATGSERGGNVAAISGAQNVVVASTEVKGSDGGIISDSEHHRVYASSSYYGVVSVIDGKTGDVTDTFPDFETPHSMALCGWGALRCQPRSGRTRGADAAKATGNLWVLSAGKRRSPDLMPVVQVRGPRLPKVDVPLSSAHTMNEASATTTTTMTASVVRYARVLSPNMVSCCVFGV